MSIRLKKCAALIASAAFVCSATYSAISYAQAPIVDASVDNSQRVSPLERDRSASNPGVSNQGALNSGALNQGALNSEALNQGELYNQLLILQQEVMKLRGIVEEQAYHLRQVKEQNRERYIDLDRRLGELAANPSATTTRTGQASVKHSAVSVVAIEGEKVIYDVAYSLVISKRFDDALEAFKQFLVDYPEGKYAPNSYYWMGELYQVITPQDLEASRQAFSQLLGQYPGHPKAADAMYKLGKVYFLKGNKDKSRQWLNKVIADYSTGANSSAADKARQFIRTNF